MSDLSLCETSNHSSMTLLNGVENEIKLSTTAVVPLSVKVSSLISTCRICLSSIFKPASLTCGHRFCEKCLDQYWRIKERPACIVCPLCRACAFNVDFTKDEKAPSIDDFRRTFSPVIKEEHVHSALMWCIKVSAIMPALYFLMKWFHPTFKQILSTLYLFKVK